MPFDRFYVQNPLTIGSDVSVEGAELHHLAHVMRIRIGESVELVNGQGALATAKLLSMGKKTALLHILTRHLEELKPAEICLGIPSLRPSKLEWVIEKGTELGADGFFIYLAEKSEKKMLGEAQLERLRGLMISAMKQSGRLFLPHLEVLPHLSKLLEKEGSILYGDIRTGAKNIEKPPFPIVFITGPESGFSEAEYNLLQKKGSGVRLSKHILRAETAPLAALSILAFQSI